MCVCEDVEARSVRVPIAIAKICIDSPFGVFRPGCFPNRSNLLRERGLIVEEGVVPALMRSEALVDAAVEIPAASQDEKVVRRSAVSALFRR